MPEQTGSAATDASALLPPLREDLALHPGPPARDGSPTWTIHDPSSARFYRIDWQAFEILCRWHLGSPRAIAASVSAETTLRVDAQAVAAVADRLGDNHLLRTVGGELPERFRRRSGAGRTGWSRWLLHNYLFMRFPLLRPEPLLRWLLPWTGWLFTLRFFVVLAILALTGLTLTWQQWDRFTATFIDLFTPTGLACYGLALIIAKSAHELGHALTARHFGCRVPTMGVALLVLWPVLYTETSEVWKLPGRRQRLAVDAAGILTELLIATLATLAWHLLDDGPLRGAAFLLATSTWILTLAVNLNPFMRFDGYYLLSDLLGIANLQERSFAMGRWWLRERLFGLGTEPPEGFPKPLQRFLALFAVATWIYRFFLFLGIAMLVYHFFFKLLGLFLFLVEITWFILAPLWREVRRWPGLHTPGAINGHSLVTGLVLLAALTATLLPWDRTVEIPATLRAVRHTVLFAPGAARLETPLPEIGAAVGAGQLLFRLASPELEHRRERLQRAIDLLRWQVASRGLDQTLLDQAGALDGELAARAQERQAVLAELARLGATAPFAGTIVARHDDLTPGSWVAAGEALLTLVDRDGEQVVEGFIPGDHPHLKPGVRGRFHPENPDLPSISVRLKNMDRVNVRHLREPWLAARFGGTLAVREQADGGLVPLESLYRVLLLPEKPAEFPMNRIRRGTVVLAVPAEAPLVRLWRWLAALLIRESGF